MLVETLKIILLQCRLRFHLIFCVVAELDLA